ncbi:MAG: SMI1/KNR4 family protein [Sandaracinaceae bacterium]|nr:SMI1/KNR4 family protein [Sandaracinaceae bacterium]
MSRSRVAELASKLIAAKDGAAASPHWTALDKLARKGDREASAALASYVENGELGFIRGFLAATLFEITKPGSAEFAATFIQGLTDDETCYWSIQGLVRSLGAAAYERVCAIALSAGEALPHRACAIKALSTSAKQTFDRGLDEDPGRWREDHLRVDEVEAWMKNGFPIGEGYSSAAQDPALLDPKTPLERVAAKLEKRLASWRRDEAANPNSLLVVADTEDLRAITQRFALPAEYAEFLARFSPTKALIKGKRSGDDVRLFGASELLDAQKGYAIHGRSGEALAGWPKGHVVIASISADPFVIDTLGSGAILFAEHGQGRWEFEEEFAKFGDFLKSLV